MTEGPAADRPDVVATGPGRGPVFGRDRLVALAVVFLLGTSVAAALSQLAVDGPSTVAELAEQTAEQVADELAAGDYDDVAVRVRPDQRARLSAGTLREGWEQVVSHVGRHRSTGQGAVDGVVRVPAADEAVQASVPLTFERGGFDLEVTIDVEGAVLGMSLRDRFVPGTGQPAAAEDPAAAEAAAVAAALAGGDFARAGERFSGQLAAALPTVELQVVWREALAAGGPYLGPGQVEVFDRRPNTVAVLPLRFEKRIAELQVTVDPDGAVVGLFLSESARSA